MFFTYLILKIEKCKRWAECIQRNIHEKKKVLGLRNEKFSLKYINYAGKKTEMKKDGATLQTVLGTTSLMFNPESDKGRVHYLRRKNDS